MFRRVLGALDPIGNVAVSVGRSQVAFRRRCGFAWLWLPGSDLRPPSADIVVSIALGRAVPSRRFKQVVHPSARHWIHHLGVRDVRDIDAEVVGWLREAADGAG